MWKKRQGINRKMIVSANQNEIPEAVNHIRETLRKKKVESREVTIAALRAEDIL